MKLYDQLQVLKKLGSRIDDESVVYEISLIDDEDEDKARQFCTIGTRSPSFRIVKEIPSW
jgi:hypothetical protein